MAHSCAMAAVQRDSQSKRRWQDEGVPAEMALDFLGFNIQTPRHSESCGSHQADDDQLGHLGSPMARRPVAAGPARRSRPGPSQPAWTGPAGDGPP